MKSPIARRAVLALAACASLIVAVFAAVPAAEASTLYACVTKSGSAHIYTKKPKKCKSKSEKLVSWNNVGPAGKNGANGTNGGNGTNGANGAVAGFSAHNASSVNILPGTIKEPVAVLSKKLPAGSFIVYAKTSVVATDTETGATWVALCTLTDKPVSGAVSEDSGNATGEVVSDFLFPVGAASISLGMSITTTTESTVTLTCTHVWDTEKSGKFGMGASNSLITAVQTSSNA